MVLFEEKGWGIEPTPAARHLYEASAEVLIGPERLERTMEELRQGRTEQIAIACFASFAQVWLPAAVTALRTQCPEMAVETSINDLHPSGGHRVPEPDVRNGALDGPSGRIIDRAGHAAG